MPRVSGIGVGAASIVLLAAALLSVGCRQKKAPTAPLRVELRPVPGSSVAAKAEVLAEGALEVRFQYGPTTAYGTESTSSVPASGRVSKTLIGLHAGATSHVSVIARSADGTVRRSGDLTVDLPPLPEAMPRLQILAARGSAKGSVMLSLRSRATPDGIGVLVDRTGRPLWYRAPGDGAFSVARLCEGRIIQHAGKAKLFEEVALDGTVIRRFNDEKSITGVDEHDLELLPNGNVLAFGAETHVVDSRKLLPGGVPRSIRWDDTVSELTLSGETVWRWSTFSHVLESEITSEPEDDFRPDAYELAHTNSVQALPDGSILLSFRNTSSVVKVDRSTGNILFRLGGKQTDYRFVSDPLGGFCRQHDARFVSPGRILLFDNGNCHSPPESRAVEYALDDTAKTATLVWQFRKTPPILAKISGSVERLSNGHTLISWGPRGLVTEVDAQGAVVWEASIPGFGAYRARVAPECQ